MATRSVGHVHVRLLGPLLIACAIALAIPAAAAAKVELIRNEQGIPTIKASNFEQLGYGYGYALAEDELCTLADTYLTSAAERSRWFGPDVSSPEGYSNIDSDIFYQRIKDEGTVEEVFSRKPPMFSQRQWVDPPFCAKEVRRTADEVTRLP